MAHLNKVVVWQRPDGGVSITNFDERDRLPGETDDQLISRIAARHGAHPSLENAIPSTIDRSNIPTDETHRNEWAFDGTKVAPDPVKVQEKLDVLAAKETNKQAILDKLGISKQEFDTLNADIIKG